MTREKLIEKFPYFKDVDFDHALDRLTGVFTRDVIRDYMMYLINNDTPFSLFIADVDNFKYINDEYGHREGDKALRQIAQFLKDSLGTSGVVGRFGGDEFIMVCEEINDYDGVWEIGHYINTAIGNLKFPDQPMLNATITTGISRFPIDTKDYNEMWNLADKALYRGKMKGRNCFIIYLESKHKDLNLKTQRDVAFSSAYLHSKIFSTLESHDNLATSIRKYLTFLTSYSMYDHVCLETPSGTRFNTVHALSKVKKFSRMDTEEIAKIVNSCGFVSIKRTDNNNNKFSEKVLKALDDQGIKSAAYCRIEAYGKTYGFLRLDMADTIRIWQNDELAIMVDAAKTIGLLLHYNKTTIDELDSGENTEIVGKQKS